MAQRSEQACASPALGTATAPCGMPESLLHLVGWSVHASESTLEQLLQGHSELQAGTADRNVPDPLQSKDSSSSSSSSSSSKAVAAS